MPALPVVPGVIRSDIHWKIGADAQAMTRLFIGYTGAAPSSSVATALAASLYTVYAAELAPYLAVVNSLERTVVTDLSSASGGQGEHVAHTPGTLADQALPANVACLASMTIGRRYRGGKPRSYLPLGTENDLNTPQTWQATFVSNIQVSLNLTRTGIGGISASGTNLSDLVNVSYYHGFTVATSPTTGRARNVPTLRVTPLVDACLAWTMEAVPASQRRRLLRQP